MRTPIIAGNWKLNKTIDEALAFAQDLKPALSKAANVEIILAPPFTALSVLAEALNNSSVLLAGQNCYPAQGAFTGEISPRLLRDAGCVAVIVGHSERRQLFGETGEFINRKVKAVLEEGLRVILCIGETLQERKDNQTFKILEEQLRKGLAGIDGTSMARLVVAYEPVWAIGTGQTASSGQAQEAHRFIRDFLATHFEQAVADSTRIIYGGSVTPENIDGLMAQPDIDGALVGGASLQSASFIQIAGFGRV